MKRILMVIGLGVLLGLGLAVMARSAPPDDHARFFASCTETGWDAATSAKLFVCKGIDHHEYEVSVRLLR